MAAAAVSVACPLRRSTRLAHAHSHTHPNPPKQHHRLKSRHPTRPTPDPEPDQDSSSSDPENELTPRALRALKRQRLALDLDGLPFSPRARPRKRRRESIPLPAKRLSSPPRSPLTLNPHSTATTNATSIPKQINDPPSDIDFSANENRPSCHQLATFHNGPSVSSKDVSAKPELSIPLPPKSAESSTVTATCSDPSPSPSPLTPLTPLTPSPESSPSLPGHDRQVLSLLPPHEPLPPLDTLPMPSSPDPSPSTSTQQQLSTESFTSTSPISLDPALDTLIPFEGLHTPFDPELSVQIPPPCQPSTPPQLQALELQDQFHSFPPPQLYVPPNPVFVRDREINIWKLACQERVDCLLRRYGIDYIKALVESEARSVSQETRSSTSPGTEFYPAPPSQTKFRLYTPASYTYSSTSWGSTSGTRKAFPVDDDPEDPDPGWSMDDGDWVDADVDMEDEDEDDYEDEDDAAEGDAEREGDATLEAVQGLAIADAPRVDAQALQVDVPLAKSEMMQVDSASPDGRMATKATVGPEAPLSPRSTPSTADPPRRPLTPVSQPYPSPPPVTPPSLPPLSSLHVPLLSEHPRAFMGRGTPPDRRRLIEWSGSGRFATNGMGPPLYLSPVPQRHASTEVGIVPMSVDTPMHPPPPHPSHTHGEWTSFLYSMLEGDGVGVGVGNASQTSEPTWYELGLGSVPTVVSENALELPLSHTHGRTPTVEQPVDEGNSSSSTLRFALG
ncbi:hypothetical protein J3R83DRAFT_12483 [Lanmaoa asiatica]|nr:hypothetical protein J3R83DRAFT_12483 [Lanmaoa asiatica]